MAAVAEPLNVSRPVLRGVEVFYSGRHTDSEGNTQEYTPDMLEQMTSNFQVCSQGDRPLPNPPIGIGHDTAEPIDLWESDTNLAGGEVSRLWTEPVEIDGQTETMLRADIAVDPEIYQWVQDGKLVRVSAEVDESPPPEAEGLGASGWFLKRIAFLGFSPPALKRTKPLQAALAGAFREVSFLRRATVKRLTRDGRRRTFLFSECSRCQQDNFQEGLTMKPREEMIAELTGLGADPLWLEAMPDEALAWLLEKLKPAAPTETPADGGAISMGEQERQLKQLIAKFGEGEKTRLRLETKVRDLEARVLVSDRNSRTLAKEETRRKVHAFCESRVQDGKLDPADVATDPTTGEPMPGTTLARLLRAVDSPVLHKFSESGKMVEKTELDLQMAEIDARPARKYREKIGAGAAGKLTSGGKDWNKIREQAVARQNKTTITGPSLEERLHMLPPAGRR